MDGPTIETIIQDVLGEQGDVIARLRELNPKVHCVTNLAANNFTANVMLALGAVPSLTSSPEEIPDFVARADALLINLGTLDSERKDAIKTGVEVATEYGKPWVLDATYANASTVRLEFAAYLLGLRPQVIRANQVEIASLCQALEADNAARALALATGSCVAATGETDIVTDGVLDFHVDGGDAIMTQVTAVGCVTSAIITAMLTVEPDPVKAALVGLIIASSVGEIAAKRARGPGSFQVEFLDALYALDDTTLRQRKRVS